MYRYVFIYSMCVYMSSVCLYFFSGLSQIKLLYNVARLVFTKMYKCSSVSLNIYCVILDVISSCSGLMG